MTKCTGKHGTECVPHSNITKQKTAIDGPLSKYHQFDKKLIKLTEHSRIK